MKPTSCMNRQCLPYALYANSCFACDMSKDKNSTTSDTSTKVLTNIPETLLLN